MVCSLTSYVREEIFQTLAVIVKRGILESDSIAKDKIFNEVTQLISTGDLTMVSVKLSSTGNVFGFNPSCDGM